MDRSAALSLVDDWLQACNAHDLDRIMSRYADDVVFTSPVAAQLATGSEGVIRGKPALREYWAEGLRRSPDLHFEVLGTFVASTPSSSGTTTNVAARSAKC
jgi:ketosteroid isomerase-like protein